MYICSRVKQTTFLVVGAYLEYKYSTIYYIHCIHTCNIYIYIYLYYEDVGDWPIVNTHDRLVHSLQVYIRISL